MPLTALSRQIGSKSIGAVKHNWYTDELFPEFGTVSGSVTTAGTSITLAANHGARFATGDIGIVHSTGEPVIVDSVAGDVLTVRRNYGGVTSPVYAGTIPDAATLLNIGFAGSQGSNTPTYKNTVEVLQTNYIQRFRKSFSIALEVMNSDLYGDNSLPYQKRKTLIECLRAVEYSTIHGVPYAGDQLVEVSAAASRNPATAGGILYYMNNITGGPGGGVPAPLAQRVTQADLTKQEFLDFIRDGFLSKEASASGVNQKLLLASPLHCQAIEAWALADMQTRPTDSTYGIKITKWQSAFGEVAIVNHPMLAGRTATQGSMALLVDVTALTQVVQKNMDLQYTERNMRNITGQEIIVGEWTISQCVEFKGSGGLHSYIKDTTSYTA